MKTKLQMHELRLVYPPISNFQGEQIKDDASVKCWLKRSNLYMLARRREVLFVMSSFARTEAGFTVQIVDDCRTVTINACLDSLHQTPSSTDEFELCANESFMEVKCGEMQAYWATPAKLLYDVRHRSSMFHAVGDYDEMQSVELLYVGISKAQDAYERLLAKAHEKRLSILSLEYPLTKGARTTDELTLLFFDVSPMGIIIDASADDFANERSFDKTAIIADAEKAFTSLLKPRYNKELYESYPRGSDGLHGTGLDRYSFTLAEAMTLTTDFVTFRGAYDKLSPFGGKCDAIIVEGDTAEFITYEEMEAEIERFAE